MPTDCDIPAPFASIPLIAEDRSGDSLSSAASPIGERGILPTAKQAIVNHDRSRITDDGGGGNRPVSGIPRGKMQRHAPDRAADVPGPEIVHWGRMSLVGGHFRMSPSDPAAPFSSFPRVLVFR
jgi:hypothetical protein